MLLVKFIRQNTASLLLSSGCAGDRQQMQAGDTLWCYAGTLPFPSLTAHRIPQVNKQKKSQVRKRLYSVVYEERHKKQKDKEQSYQKVEMSCTMTRMAVAVAILFSLTILSWCLVEMKTVCCQYCYAQPDQTSNCLGSGTHASEEPGLHLRHKH